MPIKKQIRTINAKVRRIPNKMQGIIIVTLFDRLVQKHLTTNKLEIDLPQKVSFTDF